MRTKALSDREAVRLLRRCRKAGPEPVTAAAFGEWLLNELSVRQPHHRDQNTRDGRPPVLNIREVVLAALYWLRYWHKPGNGKVDGKPCKVRAAATDILRLFDIKVIRPRKYGGETSRHITSVKALEADLHTGLKHRGGEVVLLIMLYLMEWSQDDPIGAVSCEIKQRGGLGELVTITPKQPAVLARWTNACLAKSAAINDWREKQEDKSIRNLVQQLRDGLEQQLREARQEGVISKRSPLKIVSE
jgi:hypothetical protein